MKHDLLVFYLGGGVAMAAHTILHLLGCQSHREKLRKRLADVGIPPAIGAAGMLFVAARAMLLWPLIIWSDSRKD